MTGRSIRGILLVTAILTAVSAEVRAQPPSGAPMLPDPRQMSGIPLPVSDVPAGTVTVRLIRGALTNPIAGHPVELQGPATPLQAKTNEAGRAEFPNLRPGSRVRAVAVVGAERLESQEFEVPDAAGVRVMLVAAGPDAPAPAGDPVPAAPVAAGAVILGDQSRFIFEFNDDGLSVFNILQIENTAQGPIDTPEPLVFELPDGGLSPAVLEGSSPQAVVEGRDIVVRGPFAAGTTLVQFAYSMPVTSGTLTIAQRMPAPMTRLTVLAQKVGETHLTSPQLAAHREMPAEGGVYIVGQGPSVRAGDVITFNFSGLPHAPGWPRNVALILAVIILIAGAWAGLPGGSEAAAARRKQRLEERRDTLFGDLTLLEQRHRVGRIGAREYAETRRKLVAALERIYAELDEEAAA